MKIKRIHLNNYRAFLVNRDEEKLRYTIDIPNGENLLIYGENGSGKSSLFKALKDFFVSAGNTAKAFEKNLFYEVNNNSEQPLLIWRLTITVIIGFLLMEIFMFCYKVNRVAIQITFRSQTSPMDLLVIGNF